jgi:hypothetical protein
VQPNCTQSGADQSNPCIVVLDLESVHPNARGFRKGFVNYPHGYLSPGEYNVAVRLDIDHFTLKTTKFIDLDDYDSTLGGYSGGFADGSWACYWYANYYSLLIPFGTFSKPILLVVDIL